MALIFAYTCRRPKRRNLWFHQIIPNICFNMHELKDSKRATVFHIYGLEWLFPVPSKLVLHVVAFLNRSDRYSLHHIILYTEKTLNWILNSLMNCFSLALFRWLKNTRTKIRGFSFQVWYCKLKPLSTTFGEMITIVVGGRFSPMLKFHVQWRIEYYIQFMHAQFESSCNEYHSWLNRKQCVAITRFNYF